MEYSVRNMEYGVNGEELNNSGNKWHLLSREIKFTEYSVQ